MHLHTVLVQQVATALLVGNTHDDVSCLALLSPHEQTQIASTSLYIYMPCPFLNMYMTCSNFNAHSLYHAPKSSTVSFIR